MGDGVYFGTLGCFVDLVLIHEPSGWCLLLYFDLSCFVDLVPIHETRGKLTCLRKSPHSPAPFSFF